MGGGGWYVPVHIGSHLIDNGLGAIAEEIIGIGHIVHVQTNAGLYRRLGPPVEGLRAGSQSNNAIHNRIDQNRELACHQNAADYQNRRNRNCNPWKCVNRLQRFPIKKYLSNDWPCEWGIDCSTQSIVYIQYISCIYTICMVSQSGNSKLHSVS